MAVKKNKSLYYVDNGRFLAALDEYRRSYYAAMDAGAEPQNVSPYLAECFWKIAEKFSLHKNYIGYIFRDEMIADAALCCVKYAHNFSSEKTNNPFGYFTLVCQNSFHQRIAKEKKYLYTKYKAIQDTEIFSEMVTHDEGRHEFDMMISDESRDKMDRFIRDYEERNGLVEGVGNLTPSQVGARRWLVEHGGDGCFDARGMVLAMGVTAPYKRETWDGLRSVGEVEYYMIRPRGGRIRIMDKDVQNDQQKKRKRGVRV